MPTPKQTQIFNILIPKYYREKKRDLPWRIAEQNGNFDPYKILVSEVMLQQTQVNRVIPYYESFLEAYPNINALAASNLQSVLQLWQGLGYNRRARYLREAAREVVAMHEGRVPDSIEDLVRLPGIGVNTAGAVMAYGFNKPVLFVETNIRTVIIHHFFSDSPGVVSDKQIIEVLEHVLYYANPRSFYWALMDYGTELKSNGLKNNAKSAQYTKQSVFKGSLRELRGKVIRSLTSSPQTLHELHQQLDDKRLEDAVSSLIKDGLVVIKGGKFFIAN